jgi:hypothetical protein
MKFASSPPRRALNELIAGTDRGGEPSPKSEPEAEGQGLDTMDALVDEEARRGQASAREATLLGAREIPIELDDVFPYLDRHVLFKLHWGGGGVKGEAWREPIEGTDKEEGSAPPFSQGYPMFLFIPHKRAGGARTSRAARRIHLASTQCFCCVKCSVLSLSRRPRVHSGW